jgi:hypothetical protein
MTDPNAVDADPVAKKRIEISVPEYYKKVDDGVWDELEKYLFTGFLTSPAHVLGRTFIFKSLNHNEIRNLEYFKPLRMSSLDVKISFRSSFIAHSILFIDGENVLHNRMDHIRKLMETIGKIPSGIQEEMINNLSSLNSRASRLYPLAEVYAHENKSRFKWLYTKDTPVNSPIVTGISGTESIGMNYCQQMWVALNRLLDSRDRIEAEWSNAKFIGGCFAGKGMRTIEEKDKARKEKENLELQELKSKVLYRYLNRNAGPEDIAAKQISLPDGRMATVEKMFRAESVEELANQLSSALSDEKDYHDKVIEIKQKELQKRSSSIEKHRKNLWSRPAVIDEAAQSKSIPIGGGSRVLGGGRVEAEAYKSRWQRMDLERIRQFDKIDLDLPVNPVDHNK